MGHNSASGLGKAVPVPKKDTKGCWRHPDTHKVWDVVPSLELAGERSSDLASPGDLSLWRGQTLMFLCFEGQNCSWSPPRLPVQLPQGLKEAEAVTALSSTAREKLLFR